MSKQPPYILKFILLISLLFGMFKLSAQHYPVQANVQVIPPYSVRLSDYYKANNQKLLVTIILKDLQRTDLSVRLRIRIKGQGIEMVTKDDFVPKQQIILQPGAPEMIYGDRLEEYLSPNHMNFSGITKSEFIKTGRLPEGVYQFSVEVLEMRRKEKLSNTAKAMAWLIMNEPPKITSPINNKLVKASDPASIFFTWLPRHMNSQNALSDVMYEFTMVEIWPLNQSAEEAIRSKEPIVKENFNITSFVYDARYPMLEPGRKYACRVRAYSQENQEMFKNDGYSQVVCFTFGQECKVPQGFTVEPPENGSVRLSVIPENNHSSYVVHVRDLSGNKWYGQEHNSSEFQVNQLRIGSSYECKVQAQCGSFSSRFTPIRQFTLNEEIPQKVECGKGGDVPQIDNSDPLYELKVGDKVNAGGFEVIIKEVTGSGNFSGKGVVRIGMLGNIELRTVFDDIQVNESYQLTAGEIKIVGSDIYVLTGDVRDKANEVFENEKWKDIDQAIANAEEFSNLVKDFQKEVEDVKLNQELNEARELIEKGRTLLAKEDKQGAELVKQGSDKVNAILDKINSGEYKITSNGIEFIAHNQQRYGFDNIDNELTDAEQKAYRSYYKVAEVGDTSKLSYYTKPWKSIGSYQTDQVSMKISLQEGMSVDTLHFVNKIGVQITPQKQGDNYTLLLQGKGHEEVEQITAYYNVVDDSSKRKRPISVAALNVISYDQIDKTVVLVPVNGNKTKPSIFSLQAYLNSIYKSANVKWQVEMHPGIQVEYNNDMSKGIDDGAAGILSNYTKEMNKVIQALKRSNDFDRHKKYLLFIDKSKTVNKQGFMPKKRPYGFIFTDYNRSDKQLNRTIAHELGHGIFRLTHNFDDFASLTKGSTQNLMDYAGGTQLRKFQWNDIHNLREVKWWGQDKKQNASHDVRINELITWVKENNGDKADFLRQKFYKFNVWGNKVLKSKIQGKEIGVYSEVFDDGKVDLSKPELDYVINEKYHSGFYISFPYENKKDIAFKIWTYSYEDFCDLLKEIGYQWSKEQKDKMTVKYFGYLNNNKKDCNKIDVALENIPDFVNKQISNKNRIRYLKTLNGCTFFEYKWIWGTNNDTSEEKAVLNLLKVPNGQESDFIAKLKNENELIIGLYNHFSGSEKEKFVQQLSRLTINSWTEEDRQIDGKRYFIFDNSSIYVKAKETGAKLNIWSGISAKNLMNPIEINDVTLDPLSPLGICYSKVKADREDRIIYCPAINLYFLAKEKDFNDGVAAVSFLLNFVGTSAALKVVVKGGSVLAKTLAYVELANYALNTVIETPYIKQKLNSTRAGQQFLEVWPIISTTADLAQLSVDVLDNFVRHAKSVRSVLESLPEKELNRLDELIAKSEKIISSGEKGLKLIDRYKDYILAKKLLKLKPGKIDNIVDELPKGVKASESYTVNTISVADKEYQLGKASTKVRFFEQNGKVKCYLEGAYCFTQGTPILLANDQLKPIEQIAVGDTVATYNHELKRLSFGVVKRLFKRSTKKLTRLAIAGSLLFATPSHKIYADGEYQPASSVTTDSELLAANGKKLQIQSVETIDSTASVYNFEVKGDHNYFAGANGVLVHNSCGWKTLRKRVVEAGKEARFRTFHQSIISSGLTPVQRKKLYDKIEALGDKSSDFIDDFAENVDALKKFADDDKLVDSWGKLFKDGDAVSEILRKDTKVLEWVSKQGDNIPQNAVDDLLTQIDKPIKETLEDAQGRLTFVLDRPGQSNKVVSVHTTSSGQVKTTTYSPSYNPDLNPDIPVPLSQNRLTPDYSTTNYMHPDNKGLTVRVELSGNRSTDFTRSRTELKELLGLDAADVIDETGYTWHHLDDFEIVDGKAYCTMQLVESSAHQGTGVLGMQHSGSVAQWRAYFGSGY